MAKNALTGSKRAGALARIHNCLKLSGIAFGVLKSDGTPCDTAEPWEWGNYLHGIARLFFDGDLTKVSFMWLQDIDDLQKLSANVLEMIEATAE